MIRTVRENPVGTLYSAGPRGGDCSVLYPQGHSCFVLGDFVYLFILGLGIPARKPDPLRL